VSKGDDPRYFEFSIPNALSGLPKATSQRTSYHRPMRQYPTQGHARCHDLGKDPNSIGAAWLTCAIQLLAQVTAKGRFVSACSRRSYRLGGARCQQRLQTPKDYVSHQKFRPKSRNRIARMTNIVPNRCGIRHSERCPTSERFGWREKF
jgi:hypothetical protein